MLAPLEGMSNEHNLLRAIARAYDHNLLLRQTAIRAFKRPVRHKKMTRLLIHLLPEPIDEGSVAGHIASYL